MIAFAWGHLIGTTFAVVWALILLGAGVGGVMDWSREQREDRHFRDLGRRREWKK